jgi:hypothetical protein
MKYVNPTELRAQCIQWFKLCFYIDDKTEIKFGVFINENDFKFHLLESYYYFPENDSVNKFFLYGQIKTLCGLPCSNTEIFNISKSVSIQSHLLNHINKCLIKQGGLFVFNEYYTEFYPLSHIKKITLKFP